MHTRRSVAVVAATGVLASLLLVGGSTAPATAASGTFSNTGAITLPAGAPGTTSGNATPYPSSINVTGLTGVITDVNVKLENIGHAHPDDLDIIVVSPSGDSTVLMSDACNGTDFEDFDWTFDDEAAGVMPDSPPGACTSFFYRPSSYDAGSDTWPAAFPGPHGTALTRFDGENPIGTWYLYARDDAGGDVGDIEGGWSITITTGPSDIAIPATGTSGNASPYPRTISVSSSELVTDVNVVFNGFTHSHPDDVDVLMSGPSGDAVVLMSDACGSFDVTNYFWRWDDEAAALMTDSGSTNVCSGFNHKPTDIGGGDAFPSAPGITGTTLSTFDLKPAGGNWRFYIVDDVGGDAGFLINPPIIELTTRARAATKLGDATLTISEGDASTVTVSRSAAGATAAGSVTLTLTPGTATGGGTDVSSFSQVLNFGPGELSKDVAAIATFNDTLEEGAETFTLSLSSPSGDIALGSPSSTEVTIKPSDGVAPETSLIKKPPKETKKRSAKIKVVSNEPGSTFECKVDKGGWKSCKATLKLKNLSFGKHKVQYRAVDLFGYKDASPLKIKWKVLRP